MPSTKTFENSQTTDITVRRSGNDPDEPQVCFTTSENLSLSFAETEMVTSLTSGDGIRFLIARWDRTLGSLVDLSYVLLPRPLSLFKIFSYYKIGVIPHHPTTARSSYFHLLFAICPLPIALSAFLSFCLSVFLCMHV